MAKLSRAGLAVIEGIDGSGKSQTAQRTAQALSQEYPGTHIGVADSSGLRLFNAGEVIQHKYARIEAMEPTADSGRLATLGKLGVYTLGRRLIDCRGMHQADLLISVRDPQRVDPATYATVYDPGHFGKLSPAQRLRFFDAFAGNSYPDAIVNLVVDKEDALHNTDTREMICHHESEESMATLAHELPLVLNAFQKLYDTPVVEVAGLRDTTLDQTASAIEPILATNL